MLSANEQALEKARDVSQLVFDWIELKERAIKCSTVYEFLDQRKSANTRPHETRNYSRILTRLLLFSCKPVVFLCIW